jgi:DNA-directed RNA polymerase specialized sigma24 family protein
MANDTIGSVSKWILGARQGDPVAIVDEQVVRLREVRRQQNENIPQELPRTEYLSKCEQDLELMLSKADRHGDLQAVLDQMDDLISMLRDKQSREIASRKLQGYANREIGDQLGLVSKTVDRKAAKIEARWKQYLDNDRRNC